MCFYQWNINESESYSGLTVGNLASKAGHRDSVSFNQDQFNGWYDMDVSLEIGPNTRNKVHYLSGQHFTIPS